MVRRLREVRMPVADVWPAMSSTDPAFRESVIAAPNAEVAWQNPSYREAASAC
jgi:hypothetical protein